MPRVHRFEFPGALVHIMSRGLNGIELFRDDEDRHFFLQRLAESLRVTGYTCHAWALMDNHYHLLLRTSELPMSKVMRPLNGSFGRWYNKKYGRRGYLYQDRFKSILCQDQEYAHRLIRYIHLNPVRVGTVKTLRELELWEWCGHGCLVGNHTVAFQDRTEALRRFGRTTGEAVRAYRAFVQAGLDENGSADAGELADDHRAELDASQKGLPAIVGNPEFVRLALSKNKQRLLLVKRFKDNPEALNELAGQVCAKHAIALADLQRRGRNNPRSTARKDFCARAHSELQASDTAIARYLQVTLPSVSNMLRDRQILPS